MTLPARSWSTTTAASTSAPPSNCTGPSVSPKISAASATVHAGSTVETMLAVDGPTRSRPRKNVVMARTVEISDRPTSDSHAPVSKLAASNWPVANVKMPTETSAPVATTAVSANGSAPPTIVSATRM